MTHAIDSINLFRIWALGPNNFCLTVVSKTQLFVPLPFYFSRCNALFVDYFCFNDTMRFCIPAPSLELDEGFGIGLGTGDLNSTPNVNVFSADDKVAGVHARLFALVELILEETDVVFACLREVDGLAGELALGVVDAVEGELLIRGLCVKGTDWRVVRNLLCEEPEVLRFKFICFSK